MRAGGGSRPPGGDHGPGNGASRPPTDSGTGIAGQVEHAAGADGGGAGRECCAGHDADVRLAAGEAEAGPTRTNTYPAAAPRRPAPRAGSRRVALTIG